jgi:DNA-nicking Smr family endonuclease
MTGSAENRLDSLNLLIARAEQRRAEQIKLIADLDAHGQRSTEARQVLEQIEDALAALRARAATFQTNPRHT